MGQRPRMFDLSIHNDVFGELGSGLTGDLLQVLLMQITERGRSYVPQLSAHFRAPS